MGDAGDDETDLIQELDLHCIYLIIWNTETLTLCLLHLRAQLSRTPPGGEAEQ